MSKKVYVESTNNLVTKTESLAYLNEKDQALAQELAKNPTGVASEETIEEVQKILRECDPDIKITLSRVNSIWQTKIEFKDETKYIGVRDWTLLDRLLKTEKIKYMREISLRNRRLHHEATAIADKLKASQVKAEPVNV